jgi:outer membrane protein assembly factor BamB
MARIARWFVIAVIAVSGLIAVGATARTTPADAPDQPVAVDADPQGDLFLAMEADVLDQGGVARMSPECVSVATWPTAAILDFAVRRADVPDIWTLEDWPESQSGELRLRRYALNGALAGWFPVAGSARYIDDGSTYPNNELYIAHVAAGTAVGHVSVHTEDGRVRRSWNLPGSPLGLAVANYGGNDQPVYVVTGGPSGHGGTLLRYSTGGVLAWEKPLDFVPTALSVSADQAYVAGAGAAGGGQVVQYRGDATVIRSWPLVDFAAMDLVAASATGIWVLGHPPSDLAHVTLRRYKYDGTLVSTCDRFPQPSEPTPEGTAACPAPTPGAEAWRYAASGKVAGGPAVAADGTTYWATSQGLLYAVDCAGRRKWLFEYRVESGGYGAEAFEGAPAVDEDGIIYIGDDVVVPNYFFAIRPDGKVKWVQHYESTYSQIDTSPALAADGHIFAASNGWGAGVSHGAILVLHRDGRLLRPTGGAWSEDGVGPITDSPVVLADGDAAYLAPPFQQWVLPTGTPPTVTPVPPRPTRTATPSPTGPTATSSTTPGTATAPSTATATGQPTTATPGPTITAPPSPTTTVTEPPPGFIAFLPRLLAQSTPMNANASRRSAGPAQPLPPPYVTQPVPARLRLVQAGVVPDIVVDLPGLTDPSSPATDGRDIWFTAIANDGAHLLAYRAGDPPTLRLDWNVDAAVAAAPVLGRTDTPTGRLEVLLMGTDGRLVALDASAERGTARVRWSRFIGLPAAGAPALGDDGRVYVAAGQVVQALDRATGDLAWSLALDSPASGSVNLAPGGMLYVATASGEVLAVGTAATGLDPLAAWPAFRRDARNTGARDGGG